MEMELLEETKGKRNSLHKMPDFTRISNPHMISIHSENNQTKKLCIYVILLSNYKALETCDFCGSVSKIPYHLMME